jgi:hypothetical protein
MHIFELKLGATLFLIIIFVDLNSLPSKYLNGLQPGSINSSVQDPEVDKARRSVKGFQEVTHWPSWEKAQLKYEKSLEPLQINTFVYANFAKQTLMKSYDAQVRSSVFSFVQFTDKNWPLP